MRYDPASFDALWTLLASSDENANTAARDNHSQFSIPVEGTLPAHGLESMPHSRKRGQMPMLRAPWLSVVLLVFLLAAGLAAGAFGGYYYWHEAERERGRADKAAEVAELERSARFIAEAARMHAELNESNARRNEAESKRLQSEEQRLRNHWEQQARELEQQRQRIAVNAAKRKAVYERMESQIAAAIEKRELLEASLNLHIFAEEVLATKPDNVQLAEMFAVHMDRLLAAALAKGETPNGTDGRSGKSEGLTGTE